MDGWIGVDLDGTLARYDGWVSETHIGEPIEPMLERVRSWLADGIEVRVFTARACRGQDSDAVRAVEDWTERHVGRRLAVTCQKDYGMIQLWDDRAIRVEPNTGRIM